MTPAVAPAGIPAVTYAANVHPAVSEASTPAATSPQQPANNPAAGVFAGGRPAAQGGAGQTDQPAAAPDAPSGLPDPANDSNQLPWSPWTEVRESTVTVTPAAPAPSPSGGDPEVRVGKGKETVLAMVAKPHAAPVTGSIDGIPYSIGGPGEPLSFTVTGIPLVPIPVSMAGQNYTLNPGGTIFVPLANEPASGLPAGSPPSSDAPAVPVQPVWRPSPKTRK